MLFSDDPGQLIAEANVTDDDISRSITADLFGDAGRPAITASLTYRTARLWLLVRAVRMSTWALERIYARESEEYERSRHD